MSIFQILSEFLKTDYKWSNYFIILVLNIRERRDIKFLLGRKRDNILEHILK